ncbi:hypothetical protein ACJRO7_023618 [Eucalyptus globulus]|uniref:Uncharacterized protein n=1 Tax=Eucalyptus globulus TaxID=34317 RepID=A0ABD3K4X4_EUCGL
MASLMKLAFLKFRSSFPTTGTPLSSKSSIINREYKQAFKTRSYIGRTRINRSLLLPSLSNSAYCMAHLSESLLEPELETLSNMIKTFNIHHLLGDYFQASFIHQTRTSNQSIRRAIKLAEMVYEDASHVEEQNHLICRELSVFTSLTNPLSAITSVQFQGMHNNYLAVRNYIRMGEMMWEVVKEFHELEEHIHFCLVTMNKPRRLVVEDILISQSMS